MTLGAHDLGLTDPTPTAKRAGPTHDRAFAWCALGLLVLCVAPVWAGAAVPMQDYPQHLFIASVLRGDAAHTWSKFYEWQLGLEPYSGCYWVLRALAPALGLDVAGRCLVSAYFLLLAGFVVRSSSRSAHTPWGLLLVFPLATHQEYFHGLLNYLIALGLLLIALDQLRAAAASRWTVAQVCGHIALLLVMLLFHPFCVLAYCGVALCEAVLTKASASAARVRLLPACLSLCLVVSWRLFWYRTTNSTLHWIDPVRVLTYLRPIISGMRSTYGPTWHIVVWLGLLAVFVRARATGVQGRLDRRDVIRLLGFLAACFLLPFWVGRYSYFNLRAAALVYFQLAIIAGCFALGRRAAVIVVSAVFALTADASLLQMQVGRESAEILPLVAQVGREQKVTAITFDDASAYLDRRCFPEQHRHEIFYYQLYAGGVSPHLWRLPLVPVRYKPKDRPTEPHSIRDLRAQDYRVVFARNAPVQFAEIMRQDYSLRGQNGSWVVFERRP